MSLWEAEMAVDIHVSVKKTHHYKGSRILIRLSLCVRVPSVERSAGSITVLVCSCKTRVRVLSVICRSGNTQIYGCCFQYY